ncbi:ribonuclease H-like domain-containing protein [Tanacetum coccineum]
MTIFTTNMFGIIDIYDLNLTVGHPNGNQTATCFVSKSVWHNKLGHPYDQVVDVLQSDLKFTKDSHVSPCDICHKAKQTRKPFPLSDHKTTVIGELVHVDLWGPYKVISKDGFRYFMTIVDDYTRAVWIYLIKTKDEVYGLFVNFINLIHNQFKCSIKNVRSDNDTEFMNNKMNELFSSLGIVHQTSCAYTPQQNGVVERKHRHLLNVARSLLFQSGLPLNMWTECILTAAYLINRLPSFVLNGKSLFELVYGLKPKLSHLRSFGCLCYSSVLNNSDKFSARSEKYVLIGFSTTKKAYKVYSLESKLMFYLRDVKFYEAVCPFKMSSSLQSVEENCDDNINNFNFFDKKHLDDQTSSLSPNDDGRVNFTPNDEGNVFPCTRSTPTSDGSEDNIATSMGENTSSEGTVPFLLIEAINNEIEALNRNNTWTICDLLKGRKDVGSKWLFKIKYKSTRAIDRYKAMLVAKGFSHREGFDYMETFSPVVKMSNVRCMLNVAMCNNWDLFQLDINNALLYGDLYEDVYMTLPPGFDNQRGKVCKLNKSVYVLKQAPRQ